MRRQLLTLFPTRTSGAVVDAGVCSVGVWLYVLRLQPAIPAPPKFTASVELFRSLSACEDVLTVQIGWRSP